MRQQGFNRIEILILLVIFLTLLIVFLNLVFGVQKSARDAKRHGDIEVIAKELEVHFNRRANQYCQDAPIDTYCPLQNSWFEKDKIPVDPLTLQPYLNLPTQSNQNFYICAKLEIGDQFCQGGQQ